MAKIVSANDILGGALSTRIEEGCIGIHHITKRVLDAGESPNRSPPPISIPRQNFSIEPTCVLTATLLVVFFHFVSAVVTMSIKVNFPAIVQPYSPTSGCSSASVFYRHHFVGVQYSTTMV
jgi:hypothetical protein